MFWAAVGVLWLSGVTAGLWWLASYDNRPGAAATVSATWPAGSRLTLDSNRPTLVVLAHPRCDCTQASMTELAELIARTRERPKTYVVFIKPGVVPNGWERTDLWRRAAQIPDVTVIRDDAGLEAQRFGAETSGQVFLYGANGGLLFSGGITASRGHAGDNAGRATILALLNREQPTETVTPVFGCPLFSSADDRLRTESTTLHGSHQN
jgi:hypothetical protein